MKISEKIKNLTKESNPVNLYHSLLSIFHNMGDVQKEEGGGEVNSIYSLDECCLPFLSFLGVILNNLKADPVMMQNLLSQIDFLEYQIFDTEFEDKYKCLSVIKELKDAFMSPEHVCRTYKKTG